MNTLSSNLTWKLPTWQMAILLTLGFWLSASLVLDWVIMPSLYLSGMMNQAGFTTAGYVIFWNFNRLELLSAAIILTGILSLSKTQSSWHLRNTVLSVLLLSISLVNTYFFTPQMCSIGLNLNLFASSTAIPLTMNLLHGGYLLLEMVKFIAGGMLLNYCWKQA